MTATLTMDDGPAAAIASLGTIGTAADVDVRVAAVPTVFVGHHAQAVGLVSIIERRAGALDTNGSATRFLRVRLVDGADPDPDRHIDDVFSEPPWIIVTSGDLKLRVQATATAGTVAQGTMKPDDPGCIEWEIYSESTTASTLALLGAAASGPLALGALNGPRIDVCGGLTTGA